MVHNIILGGEIVISVYEDSILWRCTTHILCDHGSDYTKDESKKKENIYYMSMNQKTTGTVALMLNTVYVKQKA